MLLVAGCGQRRKGRSHDGAVGFVELTAAKDGVLSFVDDAGCAADDLLANGEVAGLGHHVVGLVGPFGRATFAKAHNGQGDTQLFRFGFQTGFFDETRAGSGIVGLVDGVVAELLRHEVVAAFGLGVVARERKGVHVTGFTHAHFEEAAGPGLQSGKGDGVNGIGRHGGIGGGTGGRLPTYQSKVGQGHGSQKG